MPKPWDDDADFKVHLNDYTHSLSVLTDRIASKANPEQDNRLVRLFSLQEIRLSQIKKYVSEKNWHQEWKNENSAWLQEQNQKLDTIRIKLKLPKNEAPAPNNSNINQNAAQRDILKDLEAKVNSIPANDPGGRFDIVLDYFKEKANQLNDQEKLLLLIFIAAISLQLKNQFIDYCKQAKIDWVKYFVKFYEDHAMEDPINEGLLESVKAGQLKVVEYLLVNKHAKFNYKDSAINSKGWTILHWAVKEGHFNVVDYLWEKYPDLIREKTARGFNNGDETILHIAVRFKIPIISSTIRVLSLIDNRRRNQELKAFLLNSQDMKGKTPLHWAVEKESIEDVKALIDAGADLDIRNEASKTPLQLAEYQASDGWILSGSAKAKQIIGIIQEAMNKKSQVSYELPIYKPLFRN